MPGAKPLFRRGAMAVLGGVLLVLADAARTSEQRRQQLIEANAELEAEIAERRRVEAELRAALEREKQVGEFRARFVSRMSHEFRTPLAIAMTASDLLKSYADRMTDEQKAERLDKIQTEIRNMGALLDDILMMNKIESGSLKFAPVHTRITDLCAQVVERAQETTERHRLTLDISGDCPPMPLDPRLMMQLLAALLSNAVKYSPEGGSVKVTLQCEVNQVRLAVCDEGIGIPSNDLPHVFKPFYRGSNVSNVPGIGLGLAIAHHVADLHDGALAIETALDHGTTITLRLPVPALGN